MARPIRSSHVASDSLARALGTLATGAIFGLLVAAPAGRSPREVIGGSG